MGALVEIIMEVDDLWGENVTGSRTRWAAIALGAALFMGMTACAPGESSDSGNAGDSRDPSQETSDDTGAENESDDSSGVVGVTLPGTGRYAIGTDAPFGGYQMRGEPSAVPAGCTWSIEDADGTAIATSEANGMYVFLTNIPEADVFVTDGCPDWEQFE